MKYRGFVALAAVVGLALCASAAVGQGDPMLVVSTVPAAHIINASQGAAIRVRFDRPVKRSTVVARTSFWAFGRWSGPVGGSLHFLDGDRTVELRHGQPFSAGEMVTVFLSSDIEGKDGVSLRPGGYSFQFWIRAQATSMNLFEVQRLTTRSSSGGLVRSYGGIATDFDHDGYPDLTIVNEDADDLRIFRNRGDGSGLVEPFETPPHAVGDTPSPSEPSDFDRDGNPDIVVANFGGSISVLRGRNDGTLRNQQLIPTVGVPRGLGVLDADGDGDVDIVHTTLTGELVLLKNDGVGQFGAPIRLPAAGTMEWALGVADMTEDGILDLITGDQEGELLRVYAGLGDGSFEHISTRSAGGRPWMLVLGDVNGDGREDVAVVNAQSDNGAIVRGVGGGQLGPPVVVSNAGFPLATDLGDLDGDGDLDWVTSSFSGPWRIFENRNGTFVLDRAIPADEAASCSLLVDLDRDGDLDIALIDEIADQLVIFSNGGPAVGSTLMVQVLGTGSGTVTSMPEGIDCEADCSEEFAPGETVTLSAHPDADSLFTGWSGGGCSGTDDCVVEVDDNLTVTASFEPTHPELSVVLTGSGGGTVSSNPAGISCGPVCTASFDFGSQVTLTAVPAAGSAFRGWSGADCSGLGGCLVNLDESQQVVAQFDEVIVCVPDDTTLCLNEGRFQLRLEWLDHAGRRGSGHVVPEPSDDSGLFWFFEADNWEMLVKVINGCSFNEHYWVFAAAATDVDFTIVVIDTVTGVESIYRNELGHPANSITHTSAFATCP